MSCHNTYIYNSYVLSFQKLLPSPVTLRYPLLFVKHLTSPDSEGGSLPWFSEKWTREVWTPRAKKDSVRDREGVVSPGEGSTREKGRGGEP